MTPEHLSTIEQALLRRSSGHAMLRMVAGAAEDAISRAKSTIAGGSFTLNGRSGWFQTTAKGIGWNPHLVSHSTKPSEFEVFVTWQRMRAHAALVTTAPLLKEVRAYLKRDQKHSLDAFNHSCPNRDISPKGHAKHQKWWDEKHMPEFHVLSAQRKDLIDRALPAHIMWEEESESLPSD